MPAIIPALPAIIGAAGAIGGSALQNKGANKAAGIQSTAAQQVADQTGQIAGEYGGYIANAGNIVGEEIIDETRRGQAGVNQGVISANEILNGMYGRSADLFNPYMQAGQQGLNALTGAMDEKFAFSEDDPSYQFRLAEGQKALERSAAARGGALGGAAAKAITRYGQNFASTEYEKAFQRFTQQRQQRMQAASILTNAGQNATSDLNRTGIVAGTQAAGNLTRGAEFAATLGLQGLTNSGQFRYNSARDVANLQMQAQGLKADALTGGANARGLAAVQSGNTWGNAFNNSMITLADFLKPYTTGRGSGGPD